MIEELIAELEKYNHKVKKELIKKAYNFARKSHAGQKRDDGTPYFEHPYNVALILAQMKADTETVVAALLHDVVEDSEVKLKKLRNEFGDNVAKIVSGLTKLDWNYFKSAEEYTAENMRKILLAANKDPRVILIKLADRLHNLIDASKLEDNDKRKRIAEETQLVFIPIAYKLGINKIKDKMQDLCFKYLNPIKYNKIMRGMKDRVNYLRPILRDIVNKLVTKLKAAKIHSKIYWRTKSIHSTFEKMERYSCTIDEVYDLCALRIVTDTISNCYLVGEIVKSLGKQFLKFGNLDYIKNPKPNGYRSLHLLMDIKKNILEFQVRTREMNNEAEYGFLHWQYKRVAKDKGIDKKMVWLKQILEWQKKSKNAEEFLKNANIDLFHKEIIVFTPKGDSFHLPEGSTPIDFAYAVHTDLGDKCDKAKVNSKLVPLKYKLNAGDKVEIVTSKNKTPSREWLKFVKSGKAKEKIRKALGLFLNPNLDRKKKEISSIEDLTKYLNVKRKNIKLSKCCNPSTKDRIVAFHTKEGKITIHKEDCSNVYTLDEKRKINIDWEEMNKSNNIDISMGVEDRPGIISDILEALSVSNLRVVSLDTSDSKKGKISLFINVELLRGSDPYKLKEVLGKVKGVNDLKFAF